MTNRQIEELQLLGFQIGEEDARGNVTVSSERIPDLDILKKLILTMTFDDEIKYWDAYKQSPTDPGGYVSALRWDEERVAYMEGNHGWTSSWRIVSVEEMAEHIQKNWDKDCDRGAYLNKVQIGRNKYKKMSILSDLQARRC